MSHRIVVLLALAVLINYVDRGNLAVAAPILTRELALTNSQLGVLLSAFFWISPMVSAIVQTLAGSVAAGRWYGAQNVSGQMAGVVAPLVTGFIVDRTGQFYLAFMVSAAVLLLAAVAYGALIPRIEPVRWADDGRELTVRV